jgi:ubiquinone biosynthesis accessory factor UbiJ
MPAQQSSTATFDTTIDATIVQAITVGIESIINTALRYDPSSKQKISQINDTLAIHITAPNMTLYFHGQDDGVSVLSYYEGSVSTQLSGSAFALFSLLKQPTSLANSGVQLSGSVALLQQWQTIFETLDIDWEDALGQLLGNNVISDTFAPLATDYLKQSAQWARQQQQEHQRLIAEYLPEELNVIPSKPEVEDFIEQVAGVRSHTDRLAARIQLLKNQLTESQLVKAEPHSSQDENKK